MIDTKCCSHLTKRSQSVHPFGLQNPTDCAGAPIISWSSIRFRGKISMGGKNWPLALMAQMLVTFPTCRTPLVAMTLPGTWTFVIPVSSMFHIFDSVKVCLFPQQTTVCLEKLRHFNSVEANGPRKVCRLWNSDTQVRVAG